MFSPIPNLFCSRMSLLLIVSKVSMCIKSINVTLMLKNFYSMIFIAAPHLSKSKSSFTNLSTAYSISHHFQKGFEVLPVGVANLRLYTIILLCILSVSEAVLHVTSRCSNAITALLRKSPMVSQVVLSVSGRKRSGNPVRDCSWSSRGLSLIL